MMSFITDFIFSYIQYFVAKFDRNIAIFSEQLDVLRIGFCQEHIVIIPVLILKHTQSTRTCRQFPGFFT